MRFHEDLQDARLAISARRASLALLRAVLRWGRRRYPRVLSVDVAGLFQVPSAKRPRLIRAADPLAVERIIEAVLERSHCDPLGPIRDAALVAAMAFTVAARPSEWLVSATWRVREGTVELQAVQNELGDESEVEVGLIGEDTINNLLAAGHIYWPHAAPEMSTAGSSPRSDIFAMGATLHRLLTGEHPLSDPAAAATGNFTDPHRLNHGPIGSNDEPVETKRAAHPSRRTVALTGELRSVGHR